MQLGGWSWSRREETEAVAESHRIGQEGEDI